MTPNRTAQVLSGFGLAAAAGFAGSLLRRRPPTIYADGLAAAPDLGHRAGTAAEGVSSGSLQSVADHAERGEGDGSR